MRTMVHFSGMAALLTAWVSVQHAAHAQEDAANAQTQSMALSPIAQPQPRPKLDPNLLHWHNADDAASALTGTQDDLFWDKDIRKRYSLYGANLYSVNLDVSVALKPGRLMSLDAAW